MSTPPITAPPAPQTVRISFWLHIVSAILGLVGVVVAAIALPATIQQGIASAREATQGRSTSGVDLEAVATGTAIGVVALGALFAVAFAVLTIVFARKMLQGRNWARIVLAVFAGLQLFGVLGSYGVGALHFLVALAALILSFLPASNAWFRQVKAAVPTV